MIHPSGSQVQADWFKLGPGLGGGRFLETSNFKASNFAALWSIVPTITDLNLLKKYTKNQEPSYKYRLGFALSNRPHLHRAYLLPLCKQMSIAVHQKKSQIPQQCLMKVRCTLLLFDTFRYPYFIYSYVSTKCTVLSIKQNA